MLLKTIAAYFLIVLSEGLLKIFIKNERKNGNVGKFSAFHISPSKQSIHSDIPPSSSRLCEKSSEQVALPPVPFHVSNSWATFGLEN